MNLKKKCFRVEGSYKRTSSAEKFPLILRKIILPKWDFFFVLLFYSTLCVGAVECVEESTFVQYVCNLEKRSDKKIEVPFVRQLS